MSKSIAELIDEAAEKMCDAYCKMPFILDDQDALDAVCRQCPMTKLTEGYDDEPNGTE